MSAKDEEDVPTLNIHQRMKLVMVHCPQFRKDETATIKTQSYRYADANQYFEGIKPLLGQYGVAIEVTMPSPPENGHYCFQVSFVNEDNPDDRIVSTYYQPISAHLGDKAAGSATTYSLKYVLRAMLVLAADDDLDGMKGAPERAEYTPSFSEKPAEIPTDGSLVVWWPKAHKGKEISTVPSSYLDWCIKSFTKPDDADKTAAVKAEIARRQDQDSAVDEDPHTGELGEGYGSNSEVPPSEEGALMTEAEIEAAVADDDEIPF